MGLDYHYTCPTIDRDIDVAEKWLESYLEDTFDEMLELVESRKQDPMLEEGEFLVEYLPNSSDKTSWVKDNLSHLSSGLEHVFENLRSCNEGIRKAAENQIEGLQEEISELESEVSELENTVASLEAEA